MSFELLVMVGMEIKKDCAEFMVMSSYEFSNGKFKISRTIFDKLSIAEQTAKVFLPQKMVGAIVQKDRKGLD